jgi:[ribosomal protein S5]-alanine N-acetyltransferase
MGLHVETARFLVRTLQREDATERYLAWFSDPAVDRYIVAARQAQTIATLRAFIAERLASASAEFLGIFVRSDADLHIGNIKYEPIDDAHASAVVGVLIGDPAWRGKGVFSEVFTATAHVLHGQRGIKDFWLGVDDDNRAALAGYRKAGFAPGKPPAYLIAMPQPGCTYMLHSLAR